MSKIDKIMQESRILTICSSNYFFPELQCLNRGILLHLQLSKLNKDENPKRREKFITSAEGLFDLSIPGLLIAVAPRYRYCSGATFTVAVAVAPLLFSCFLALLATATFKKEN